MDTTTIIMEKGPILENTLGQKCEYLFSLSGLSGLYKIWLLVFVRCDSCQVRFASHTYRGFP